MRVLLTIHNFAEGSRFGAELYTYYLARSLARCGVTVKVFYAERGVAVPTSRCFDGLAATAVPLRTKRGPSGLDYPAKSAEAAFSDELDAFSPDVVHVNHLLNLSLRLPEIARKAGCRVVFTLHDFWLACPKVKFLDRSGNLCTASGLWKCSSCARARYSRMSWPSESEAAGEPTRARRAIKEGVFNITERPLAVMRLTQRRQEVNRLADAVDVFIAPTRFLGQRLLQCGLPGNKIMVCDYGTEGLEYDPVPKQPEGRLRFGFLGALTTEKGIHVLLDAFRGLLDADLYVYGPHTGRLQGPFSDVCRQPNIHLQGRIGDEEKRRVLPLLDALIVPSVWYENSPLVIHEAFEAGVPVICSNIGGMAELVTDGVDGLHFDVGCAAGLRRTVEKCIRTPGLLQELRGGINRPKGMDEHVRCEIIPLYEALVRGPEAAWRSGCTVLS